MMTTTTPLRLDYGPPRAATDLEHQTARLAATDLEHQTARLAATGPLTAAIIRYRLRVSSATATRLYALMTDRAAGGAQ